MIIKVKLSREENIKHYNASEIDIDIEEYLKGVVPAEIGNAHVEACAAQAIAARNYTVNKVKSKGYITDQSSTDQAFRASRLTGYPNAYEGVNKTRGQLLYYKNSIARCYYSNSNGGRTTSSEERWGGKYAYLISQDDPYDNGNGDGHGVGMSQIGAKNRAKDGHTYQEILAFYYPGTHLEGESKMTIEQFLLQWMAERIGNPYIYGATEKKCTTSYRKARMEQYPDYAANIKNNCYVLSGKGSSCEQCKWYDKEKDTHKYAYDCAQFIRWGAKAAGLPAVVSGATSQWKSNIWDVKGSFKDIPNNKLCCVFRDDNGIKEHVGWYYNGYAYHAQGHSSGVVKTDNKQYKSWTHYAIMKGIYDANGNPIEMDNPPAEDNSEPIIPPKEPEVFTVLYQAKVKSADARLNLREAPNKTADRLAWIPPQAIVDVIEETNAEWWKVIYNNQTGYAMNEYLTKLNSNTEKEYYIKVRCGSEEDAKLIAKALQGATIVEK